MGSWIKKSNDVVVSKEMENDFNRIEETDAFAVKITDAHLQESQADDSKSLSLVIGIENEDKNTGVTYFTVLGRDGETYFESTVGGKKVKKQHFGLSIANTLFEIALGKEIFDVEPAEVEYKRWDKEAEEMVDTKGDGFPELIGKEIGVCWQMTREIDGADSKEFGSITHFFDPETGLFAGEDAEDGKDTKLDKWLKHKKEYIIKEVEKPKSSGAFGKKKSEGTGGSEEAPKKRKWGK